ncbi:MAG: hypothetical protein SV253_06655 [Halobacteria archaeon]|nr:hypothetical protein [Halobacteria archaeon]
MGGGTNTNTNTYSDYRDRVRRLHIRLLLSLSLTGLFLSAVPRDVSAHGLGLGTRVYSLTLETSELLVLCLGLAVVSYSLVLVPVEPLKLVTYPKKVSVSVPRAVVQSALVIGRLAGVLTALLVVVTAIFGEQVPASFALITVWSVWWSGYVPTVYLVSNTWETVSPWRTLANYLPSVSVGFEYPRLGSVVATGGFLLFVWLLAVSPLSRTPYAVGVVVGVYTGVTLLGAVVFGDAWFERADPLSLAMSYYGTVSPVSREGRRIVVTNPVSSVVGSDLLSKTKKKPSLGFVVATVWATAYDAVVRTPFWDRIARSAVDAGLSPVSVYVSALLVGYAVFVVLFRLPSVFGDVEKTTVVSLIPLAAGYHLSHYLGYFVTSFPTVTEVFLRPFNPPLLETAPLPTWFGVFRLTTVVLGHTVAVASLTCISSEELDNEKQTLSRLTAVGAMVLSTSVFLWITTRPEVPMPYFS